MVQWPSRQNVLIWVVPVVGVPVRVDLSWDGESGAGAELPEIDAPNGGLKDLTDAAGRVDFGAIVLREGSGRGADGGAGAAAECVLTASLRPADPGDGR